LILSLLETIKSIFVVNAKQKEFYSNVEVEKVEWWISDCFEYPNLYWARLRVFSNGKADVLFQDKEKAFGFDGIQSAGFYLSEDEFTGFDRLDEEEKADLRIPKDLFVNYPNWANKEVRKFEYIGNY
jgi:hypothetical protein